MGIRRGNLIMETTTKIKLTYFGLRGRAEPARLILAHAGVDYEDERIKKEDWPNLKPKTTLGTLPTLCYNGVEIGQSVAIWRFLANEFGLAGRTNLERARADMIVDCVSDLFAGFYQVILVEVRLVDGSLRDGYELLGADVVAHHHGQHGQQLLLADLVVAVQVVHSERKVKLLH